MFPLAAVATALAGTAVAWACTNHVGYLYVRAAHTGTDTVTVEGLDS